MRTLALNVASLDEYRKKREYENQILADIDARMRYMAEIEEEVIKSLDALIASGNMDEVVRKSVEASDDEPVDENAGTRDPMDVEYRNVDPRTLHYSQGEYQTRLEDHSKSGASPVNQAEIDKRIAQAKAGGWASGWDKGKYTPIRVREMPDGHLVVMGGHHRTEQARQTGQTAIMAQVYKNISDADAKDIAAIDNLASRPMAPLDEAKMYRDMLDRGWSLKDISTMVGGGDRDSRYVQRRAMLQSLSDTVKEALRENHIKVGEAEAIAEAAAKDFSPAAQKALLDRVRTKGVNAAAIRDSIRVAEARRKSPAYTQAGMGDANDMFGGKRDADLFAESEGDAQQAAERQHEDLHFKAQRDLQKLVDSYKARGEEAPAPLVAALEHATGVTGGLTPGQRRAKTRQENAERLAAAERGDDLPTLRTPTTMAAAPAPAPAPQTFSLAPMSKEDEARYDAAQAARAAEENGEPEPAPATQEGPGMFDAPVAPRNVADPQAAYVAGRKKADELSGKAYEANREATMNPSIERHDMAEKLSTQAADAHHDMIERAQSGPQEQHHTLHAAEHDRQAVSNRAKARALREQQEQAEIGEVKPAEDRPRTEEELQRDRDEADKLTKQVEQWKTDYVNADAATKRADILHAKAQKSGKPEDHKDAADATEQAAVAHEAVMESGAGIRSNSELHNHMVLAGKYHGFTKDHDRTAKPAAEEKPQARATIPTSKGHLGFYEKDGQKHELFEHGEHVYSAPATAPVGESGVRPGEPVAPAERKDAVVAHFGAKPEQVAEEPKAPVEEAAPDASTAVTKEMPTPEPEPKAPSTDEPPPIPASAPPAERNPDEPPPIPESAKKPVTMAAPESVEQPTAAQKPYLPRLSHETTKIPRDRQEIATKNAEDATSAVLSGEATPAEAASLHRTAARVAREAAEAEPAWSDLYLKRANEHREQALKHDQEAEKLGLKKIEGDLKSPEKVRAINKNVVGGKNATEEPGWSLPASPLLKNTFGHMPVWSEENPKPSQPVGPAPKRVEPTVAPVTTPQVAAQKPAIGAITHPDEPPPLPAKTQPIPRTLPEPPKAPAAPLPEAPRPAPATPPEPKAPPVSEVQPPAPAQSAKTWTWANVPHPGVDAGQPSGHIATQHGVHTGHIITNGENKHEARITTPMGDEKNSGYHVHPLGTFKTPEEARSKVEQALADMDETRREANPGHPSYVKPAKGPEKIPAPEPTAKAPEAPTVGAPKAPEPEVPKVPAPEVTAAPKAEAPAAITPTQPMYHPMRNLEPGMHRGPRGDVKTVRPGDPTHGTLHVRGWRGKDFDVDVHDNGRLFKTRGSGATLDVNGQPRNVDDMSFGTLSGLGFALTGGVKNSGPKFFKKPVEEWHKEYGPKATSAPSVPTSAPTPAVPKTQPAVPHVAPAAPVARPAITPATPAAHVPEDLPDLTGHSHEQFLSAFRQNHKLYNHYVGEAKRRSMEHMNADPIGHFEKVFGSTPPAGAPTVMKGDIEGLAAALCWRDMVKRYAASAAHIDG